MLTPVDLARGLDRQPQAPKAGLLLRDAIDMYTCFGVGRPIDGDARNRTIAKTWRSRVMNNHPSNGNKA